MGSLLKRNKDKKLVAEKNLAAQHAIVKMGADRNVREAYFQGLVFAAVANDDAIDDAERARLVELGESLEIPTEVVSEMFQCLSGVDDDAKMAAIEECAMQLTEVAVAECFLKEFKEIWLLGGGDKSEFDEFKAQLVEWMGGDMIASIKAKEKAEAEADARRKAAEAKRLAAEKEAEKKRQAELAAERAKKAVVDQYHQLQSFVQDWISTKRVTQDVLLRVKDYLKVQYSSIPVQTLLRETCRQLIERVVELDRNGGDVKAGIGFSLSKRRPEKDKAVAEKIALETTWIVICLVLLKCKVADLKMKAINALLDHARYVDFASESSLSDFWRDWSGFGISAFGSRVEDFCVNVSGLTRVWDEVSDTLLSMTEDQKRQMHEWCSERKRIKIEDREAFARSIGVNRFMLRHADEVVMREYRKSQLG